MLEYAPNQNTLIRNPNNFPHCALILNIQIELTTRLKQSTKIFVVFGQQVRNKNSIIHIYHITQSLFHDSYNNKYLQICYIHLIKQCCNLLS